MKFNKKWLTGLGLLITTVALAATQGDRLKSPVKVGDGTATTKSMIFDIGSGGANPVIRSTNTGTLQFSNNGVDFSAFGSGAGFGVNHVTNTDFELNTNGWSTYQDAAGPVPVDATGGAAVTTFTRTTSSPLRGTASGLITKDANNRQGEGVSTPLALDLSDTNQQQIIQFDYLAGAGYAACDISVYVVEVSGPNIISPNQPCLQPGGGHIQISFVARASQSYRLAFHVASVSAVAYTVKIDNVQEGPGSTVIGPSIEDWQPYTPVVTGTGCGNFLTGHTKRVGDTVFFKVSCYDPFTARSSTTPIHISLPFPVDPAWVSTIESLGYLTISNSAGGATAAVGSVYDLNYAGSQDVIAAKFQDSVALRDVDFGSINAQWQVNGHYKVQGWDSSTFLTNTAVEYAYNTDTSDADNLVAFGYGSAGTPFPGSALTATRVKLVRFHTVIQPTDVIKLQVSDPVHKDNWFDITDVQSENGLMQLSYQNATTYGAGISTNNTSNNTDVAVALGQYAGVGATYGGAGQAWSPSFANYNWRLVKASNPLTLGNKLVGQFDSGLVQSAGQLKGTNDGTVAALQGMVGEYLQCQASGSGSSVNNTYVDACTITLTPGVWDVTGGVFGAGMGNVTSFGCSISLTSGSADDGSLKAIMLQGYSGTPFGALAGMLCPVRRIDVSVSTPVYLQFYSQFSGGSQNIRAESTMRATRIR